MAAGIQRLEFERRISRDEFDGFLHEILARLMVSTIDTGENRQMRSLGVRFGAVGVQGQADEQAAVASSARDAGPDARRRGRDPALAAAGGADRRGAVPLIEAEAVVRSLAVAMHGDRRMILPLLQLKEFDQYTTTHSLNVAVLAMGLAEHLGCRRRRFAPMASPGCFTTSARSGSRWRC